MGACVSSESQGSDSNKPRLADPDGNPASYDIKVRKKFIKMSNLWKECLQLGFLAPNLGSYPVPRRAVLNGMTTNELAWSIY